MASFTIDEKKDMAKYKDTGLFRYYHKITAMRRIAANEIKRIEKELERRGFAATDTFIPLAIDYANMEVPNGKASSMLGKRHEWAKAYLREMNRLTIKAGLRIP